MNIIDLLSSKPHNKHYLQRYIRFIQSCSSISENMEAHHILPKSNDLFPEYKSFRKNPWNKKMLTLREHYIAHLLLWKAFGGKQSQAFKLMCERTGSKTSKHYEMVRKSISIIMKGKLNPNHDGKFSKKAWSEASEARHINQAKIMADINRRTKRKPKEDRIYTCHGCKQPFIRIEHVHRPRKSTKTCSRKCQAVYLKNKGLGLQSVP